MPCAFLEWVLLSEVVEWELGLESVQVVAWPVGVGACVGVGDGTNVGVDCITGVDVAKTI